jgi:hypothetical protein
MVLASARFTSPQAGQKNLQTTDRPMAQVESGAGFVLEISTLGLLGVGAVSLYLCRKRKRL